MIDVQVLASGSSGNCYRVTDGKTNLLLECGIPIKQIKKKLNYTLSQIDACLVSHSHLDHALSAHEIVKAGIDVYLTLPTRNTLGLNGHHRIKIINPKETFEVGTWVIKPFQTEHDCDGSVGFFMHSKVSGKRLVYITDSYYSRYTFKDVSVWMLEINYDLETLRQNLENGTLNTFLKNRILKSHMSLENVIDILKANDLSKTEKIYVIHLSEENSNSELIKRKLQEITGREIIMCSKTGGQSDECCVADAQTRH